MEMTEPSIFEIVAPYIVLLFSYILWITVFIALILLIRCMLKYLKS
jgi:hypothetical protein